MKDDTVRAGMEVQCDKVKKGKGKRRKKVKAKMKDDSVQDMMKDKLVKDGDRLPLGDLTIEVIATPGHTPSANLSEQESFAFVHFSIGTISMQVSQLIHKNIKKLLKRNQM